MHSSSATVSNNKRRSGREHVRKRWMDDMTDEDYINIFPFGLPDNLPQSITLSYCHRCLH